MVEGGHSASPIQSPQHGGGGLVHDETNAHNVQIGVTHVGEQQLGGRETARTPIGHGVVSLRSVVVHPHQQVLAQPLDVIHNPPRFLNGHTWGKGSG